MDSCAKGHEIEHFLVALNQLVKILDTIEILITVWEDILVIQMSHF